MATVTLTNLRARAREKADMVGSTFVTDTANSLDAFINEGAQELHELLAEKFGEDYKDKDSSFNTVAAQSAYALPSDFLRLNGVDLQWNGDWVDLLQFNRKERNRYRNASSGIPRYRLEGANLRLYPAPGSAMSGTIWYVPTHTLLVNGSDTVDFPNGWERYVVLFAAIVCLKKEESDASSLEGELLRLRAHIEELAKTRNPSEPARVTDIYAQEVDELEEGA